MAQQQYTTKRRKGQHLTLIERGKIVYSCQTYVTNILKKILLR